ncbi:cobalamin biosynthesis protein CobG [Streptomyces sp. NPDC003691]
MLAAMSTAPFPPSSQATAVSRDRGDACPGTLKLHDADDGALARVRVPGGVVTVAQARALLDAALRLGDGALHLTSRGNVQLRGLRGGCGAELAAVLDAAGLLPSPEHERVRNIVASPLSGLDGGGDGAGSGGGGVRDVRPWLTALDAAVCASPAARALSGRFLFALDDGRGDVAALGADVTVRAVAGGDAGGGRGSGGSGDGYARSLGDAGSLEGSGDAGGGGDAAAVAGAGSAGEPGRTRGAGDLGPLGGAGDALLRVGAPGSGHGSGDVLRISGADAPRAALLTAEAFLRTVRESGSRVWRIAELDLPPGAFLRLARTALADHGIVSAPEPAPEPGYGTGAPTPGITGSALCAQAPLGVLTAAQWQEAADIAADTPAGELRLTPWRGLVVPVPGLGPADASAALGRLSRAGLVTDPGSPWLRVGACIGSPGCARSRSDVRADAVRGLAAAGRSALPLYWSGCERRCGHPPGDRIDAVAAEDGGYRLSTGGPGHPPGTAFLEDPARLADALADLAP